MWIDKYTLGKYRVEKLENPEKTKLSDLMTKYHLTCGSNLNRRGGKPEHWPLRQKGSHLSSGKIQSAIYTVVW